MPTFPAQKATKVYSNEHDRKVRLLSLIDPGPDFGLEYQEQQGLNDLLGMILNSVAAAVELSDSAENMVSLAAEAGTQYVRW